MGMQYPKQPQQKNIGHGQPPANRRDRYDRHIPAPRPSRPGQETKQPDAGYWRACIASPEAPAGKLNAIVGLAADPRPQPAGTAWSAIRHVRRLAGPTRKEWCSMADDSLTSRYEEVKRL